MRRGPSATYLGRSATRPGHIHSLGASVAARLHEELNRFTLAEAAEAFADNACLHHIINNNHGACRYPSHPSILISSMGSPRTHYATGALLKHDQHHLPCRDHPRAQIEQFRHIRSIRQGRREKLRPTKRHETEIPRDSMHLPEPRPDIPPCYSINHPCLLQL